MIGPSEFALLALVVVLVIVVPWLRRASAKWIDESALGASALQEIRAQHRVAACEEPVVQEIISTFGARAKLRVPHLRVLVVERPGLNAAALADGTVVLWAGLVDAVRRGDVTREELAGVLAHELAHIELGHGRQRAAAELLARPVVGVFGLFGGGIFRNLLVGQGLSLLRKGASRQAELEADATAILLLRRAGFPPGSLAQFLRRLAQQGATEPAWGAWLSTHPHTSERLRALDDL